MKNILVAYDGGEPARRALETGIELSKKFDAPIAVVSVVPVHPGRMPIDPWDDRPTQHGKGEADQSTKRVCRGARCVCGYDSRVKLTIYYRGYQAV